MYAYESSETSPVVHSTNPSGIDRHAEPDPIRARIVNSFSDNDNPAAAHPATVNAANPDADEAIPVPLGNEFFVITLAQHAKPARARILSRCNTTREISVSENEPSISSI